VLKNEDVAKFVLNYRDKKFSNVARDLCFEALILGSSDNVTVQVIDLRKASVARTVS
jgi:serine/threonine protein phosphatase PrpC